MAEEEWPEIENMFPFDPQGKNYWCNYESLTVFVSVNLVERLWPSYCDKQDNNVLQQSFLKQKGACYF